MIAIVSSTLQPFLKSRPIVSFYSNDERIEQTKLSLQRLREHGFTRILLVDNSPFLDKSQLQILLADFPEVEMHHLLQYQFKNKGVNELLMLLYLIDYLPTNENIFKLSGRYYPNEHFKKPEFVDLAVKKYRHSHRVRSISTRGYWVKDAETLHCFLLGCLYEHFIYSERIVGWGSLLRILFKKKSKINLPFSITIELAAEYVLRKGDYEVTYLNTLGIEGLLAGVDKLEMIIE